MAHIEFAERKFNKKYNDYYIKLNNNFVSEKGLTYNWDSRCYIPTELSAFSIIINSDNEVSKQKLSDDANLMSGFAGWRSNKKNTIRYYDSDGERVYKKINDDMTIDINKLFEVIGPGTFIDYNFEVCKAFINTYIEAPIAGALIYIDSDISNNYLELRVNLLAQNSNKFCPFLLRLIDGKTISECILDSLEFTKEEREELEKRSKVDFRTLKKSEVLDLSLELMYYTYDILLSHIFALLLT